LLKKLKSKVKDDDSKQGTKRKTLELLSNPQSTRGDEGKPEKRRRSLLPSLPWSTPKNGIDKLEKKRTSLLPSLPSSTNADDGRQVKLRASLRLSMPWSTPTKLDDNKPEQMASALLPSIPRNQGKNFCRATKTYQMRQLSTPNNPQHILPQNTRF